SRSGVAAEDHLAAEIEADPALPRPAHEGIDGAASVEPDRHAFAETGHEIAFHHRAAAGDVENGHVVDGAAEDEDRTVDQAFMARFRPPILRTGARTFPIRCRFEAAALIVHPHALPGTCPTDYAPN